MMKWLLCCILFAGLSAACTPAVKYPPEVQEMLRKLDRTIRDKQSFETGKEQHIARIKAKITAGSSEQQLYNVYDDLYSEYYQYNLDSAMRYARRKLEVARTTGLPELEHDAVLDIADRYILSGMYAEAQELISRVDPAQLAPEVLPRYYHIYHSLYEGMMTIAGDPQLRTQYTRLKEESRRQLYNRLGDNDIARLFVHTDILRDEGKPREALDELLTHYNVPGTSVHERAVLAYLIATVYHQCGEREKAMLCYAESAIHDLETPVHEYRSLYELAAILYESGDIERAYRYINCSVNDAMAANARINIHFINQLLPIISHSYDGQMKQKSRQLNYMLWGISLLSLLLAVAATATFRDKRRASEAERRTREANDELNRVNDRLHKYIGLLQDSNNIKESYLGRYLDLCSDYIGRLELYRSRLCKTARSGGGLAEVQRALSSTAFIESELDEFYAQFDATFLHLYPDFVAQFNALLQPDKQVEVRSGEAMLTTELRIFALIRLGISDSVKIAEFLRRSVSTVYNYRVKMRNAALDNREAFEKRVMRIGRLS